MRADPIAVAIQQEIDRITSTGLDLAIQRRALVALYVEQDRLVLAHLARLDAQIAEQERRRKDAVQAVRERRASERMGRAAA